ncbi:hypothetical protein D6D28_05764 [Aureobasidium pullulans]|uniref:Uncharacterized protein n=1 Tax=Aureobasidium pullulans TaxID=5580 RepID=A0A4S8SG36_AURPU|nr:hypothetical protein D6D28_05764 [Aureobasidium pullulans]
MPTVIAEAFLNFTLTSGKTEQPPKPSLPAAVVMCRVHRAFVDLNCLLTGRPGLLSTIFRVLLQKTGVGRTALPGKVCRGAIMKLRPLDLETLLGGSRALPNRMLEFARLRQSFTITETCEIAATRPTDTQGRGMLLLKKSRTAKREMSAEFSMCELASRVK